MKTKFLLLLIAFAFTQMLNAKELSDSSVLVNKSGTRILPQAGDFAVGIGANSILNFIGNIMNNTSNNTLNLDNPLNGYVFYGKYFLTDHTALRAKASVSISNNKYYQFVNNDIDPNGPAVNDSYSNSNTFVSLSFGKEMRKGFRRIQGIYGVEGVLGFSLTKYDYTYGNEMTSTDPNPTTSNGYYINGLPGRPLEQSNGFDFEIGIRGFIGIEYFIAPKMSLAGEFGWEPLLSISGKAKITTESWDYTNNQKKIVDNTTPSTSAFNFENNNSSGQLILLFHF
jgi:hypothetical protein